MATTVEYEHARDDFTRTDSTSSLPPLNIDDNDIASQLKNVGSRVRRSVSQGYATHDFSSGNGRQLWAKSTSHPTLQFGASAKTPIFISRNDLMNERMARRASRPNAFHDTLSEEQDGDMQGDEGVAGDVLSANSGGHRQYAATKSLPASAFAGGAAAAAEEDDWSSAAFSGGSFAPAQPSA